MLVKKFHIYLPVAVDATWTALEDTIEMKSLNVLIEELELKEKV